MHNVKKMFESVTALRFALGHEFPEEGDFKKEKYTQIKKWLVTSQNINNVCAYL